MFTSALNLTLFGMGFVFVFLIVLVLVMKIMSSYLKGRVVSATDALLGNDIYEDEIIDEETRLIIEQAIKQHRAGR